MAGSGFIYDTRRKLQALAAKIFPYEFLNSIYTKIICGYWPNLKTPKTYNEKVQWLKLYVYAENSSVIEMTDKYKVRQKLTEMGLEILLPKLLFECNSVADIPWESLPNQYVIKCNHGCAYNIICEDAQTLLRDKAEKKLRKWMRQDFGLYNIEPHYSGIKRKIFGEEYLGARLIDYKFFCFNGVPKFLYISKDLAHDSIAQMDYYDIDFVKLPLIRDDYAEFDMAEKPQCYDELLKYCSILSTPFPFVRVDFYVINGKPIFSEMTFTPSAGMMPITPRHFDDDWGNFLILPSLEEK